MDNKTFWVALPLIAFTLWVIVRRLVARPLTRHALNVQQAMLLLIYFAVTSGLGIFWVANQQLPVFDLHYLFGYATVLLVAAHVLINWRLVWGYFTKPSPRKRAEAAAAVVAADGSSPAGRWKWGLTAWSASILLAFLLGMRYGGTELTAAWDGGGPTPAAAAVAAGADGGAREAQPLRHAIGTGPVEVVTAYHAMSSHDRAGVLLRAPSVDWGGTPEPFKTYADAATVQLPPPLREPADPQPRLDLAALSTILFHSFGVTVHSGGFYLRASPSSGALFPTELYLAARDIDGLTPGVYHYDPKHHRLHRLRNAAATSAELGVVDASVVHAPAVFVATSVFRRTGYKYRDRAYRYATADAGHALENLRVASGAIGFDMTPLRRFDESRVAATLGVDGIEEGVLAMMVVAPKPPRPQQFAWPAAPDRDAGPLGVTSIVHLATSLRLTDVLLDEAEGRSNDASADAPRAAAPAAIVLPAPRGRDDWLHPDAREPARVLETIARRRSVRRFARTPLTFAELSAMLAGIARVEAASLSDAVRIHVACHAVEKVDAGAYRYDSASHALLPGNRGDLRTASASAALAQDVIGDAAAVVILTLDRDALFARDGARGYRHGFLQAGMLGERVYLQAGARGLGACAVGAFYDAEAARLIGVDPEKEWVVHFAAVGRPAE